MNASRQHMRLLRLSRFARVPTPVLVVLLLGGIVLIIGAWLVARSNDTKSTTPKGDTQKPTESTAPDAEQFVRNHIDPLLVSYNKKNQEAATRAISSLNERFDGFEHGIDPFTDDIVGMGTRFGIIRRMSADAWDKWWNDNQNASRVRLYVMEKFEKHVFSESDLKAAIQDVVSQFQGDLVANRNELMSNVKVVLQTHNIPVEFQIANDDFTRFSDDVGRRAATVLSGAGEKSVAVMILSNVGGEVAGFAATQIVIRVATYLATTSAVAGGATAGGAAVGGAGGTAITPGVGTAIGVGVGLVVGIIIDWWMTEEFQERLSNQCTTFLNELEAITLNGTPDTGTPTSQNSWPGLTHVFSESCKLAEQSVRSAMQQTLAERAQ